MEVEEIKLNLHLNGNQVKGLSEEDCESHLTSPDEIGGIHSYGHFVFFRIYPMGLFITRFHGAGYDSRKVFWCIARNHFKTIVIV